MKKLLILLIAILTMSFCLTGCNDKKVSPLDNVGGNVISGNGSFAVEKGDYLYFINGIGDATGSNNMGDVTKGALCRVKTSEIGVSGSKVEMVIPKLVSTSSATDGVFIYGDTVYYASPYSEKDKTGTVRSDYTDFRYFNLKNANSERICYETNTVSNYAFIESGNSVYLAYEYTVTVDDVEDSVFKVVNASSGDVVYSVDDYESLLMADDNSGKVYFVKYAYSDSLEQKEGFSEVYSYTVGGSEEMIFSGCGTNGLTRDNRNNETYKSKILKYSDFSGVTVTLIKNTGSVLVMKVTGVDTVYSSAYYFGMNLSDEAKVENLKEMGRSNTYIDTALASTSYYKSLSEVYYVENTDYLKGLVKFDYNKLSTSTHGRELVSKDASGYNISSVEGDYMYLCGTSGDYYTINIAVAGSELKKINAVSAKSTTDWFVPRTVGNKFICVLSDAIYGSYLYAIDVSGIDGEDYEDYLEKYSELDREEVLAINGTLVGIKTDADKTAFETKLDTDYPEEE